MFQEYETADSGVSEQSSSNSGAINKVGKKRKRKSSLLSAASSDPIVGSAEIRRRHVSLGEVDPSDVDTEFADARSSVGSMSPPSSSRRLALARHQRLSR